jgi:hypothetical protein
MGKFSGCGPLRRAGEELTVEAVEQSQTMALQVVNENAWKIRFGSHRPSGYITDCTLFWFDTREIFPWTPSTGGGAAQRLDPCLSVSHHWHQKPETVL